MSWLRTRHIVLSMCTDVVINDFNVTTEPPAMNGKVGFTVTFDTPGHGVLVQTHFSLCGSRRIPLYLLITLRSSLIK